MLIAWTFAFAAIGLPLHELAHALTYRLMGVPARISLSTTTPNPDEALWPATLSGPMFTLAFGCLGAFAFSRGLDAVSLAGLGLAFSQLSVRPALHVAMLSGRMHNDLRQSDEVQIADALGLPRVAVILVSFALYAFMLALTIGLGVRFGVPWWALAAAFLTAFAGTGLVIWIDRQFIA